MAVKFNTGVHFRNKNGTWDESYMSEQVIVNPDYKQLTNAPIQYVTEDVINLSELDEGIYMVDHEGTNVTLTNKTEETMTLPDKSVLFVAKIYQTTKAQVFADGIFYAITDETELETDLPEVEAVTVSQVQDIIDESDIKPEWHDLDSDVPVE